MDFDLTTEQRELKAICRDVAQGVIALSAEEWNRAHRFPVEVFRQIAHHLLGLR